jgi:hypothetical protein
VRKHAVIATVAAATALLFTVTACTDGGGGRKRSGGGGSSSSGGSSGGGDFDDDDFDDDFEDDFGDDATFDPEDEPEGPGTTELVFGESYAWEAGLTVTVYQPAEYLTPEPADLIPDGELPFIAEVTLLNNGTEPVDLSELSFVVGTAGGGSGTTIGVDGAGFREGTLAPGATREVLQAWSLDVDTYGRDIEVSGMWFGDIDTPLWSGTLR